MKTIRLALLVALFGGLTFAARAADRAFLQGILIAASHDAGQTDRRLAQYEPTLRRILRFESFKFRGDDTGSFDVPGSGSLMISDGHELAVTTESSDGKTVHVKIRWTSGGRTLMNTGLVLRSGVPAVLGGPPTDKGEVYAVILIAR
ncbi:MAG TPA: hypothetical protein VG734_16695 [Lacunisphaera sp.]|nr:hypothetical protein [Lacunisphaera sp.]